MTTLDLVDMCPFTARGLQSESGTNRRSAEQTHDSAGQGGMGVGSNSWKAPVRRPPRNHLAPPQRDRKRPLSFPVFRRELAPHRDVAGGTPSGCPGQYPFFDHCPDTCVRVAASPPLARGSVSRLLLHTQWRSWQVPSRTVVDARDSAD
jgi:hypothetical protein